MHANFVFDTGITLVRRIVRGEKWYSAHREHFYQRLVRSGKSHTFVTSWEMGLQLLVLLLMIRYVNASGPMQIGAVVGVLLIWAAFFWYCEKEFRKHAARRSPMLSSQALNSADQMR